MIRWRLHRALILASDSAKQWFALPDVLGPQTYDEWEEVAMFRKVLIGAGLSLCVAACASSPSAPAAADSSVTAAAQRLPAGCVSQSATRITVGPTECAAVGHILTGDAIKSVGATEPGEALRLLDPTLIVEGH
jgi:hypothetical protein